MELSVQTREKFGRATSKLRHTGMIPAELYGRGLANQHLAVQKEEFKKLFKAAGENTVIYLTVDGKKQPALIHDVQRDYLTGEAIHIDFYGVRMDEKIAAPIPVEFFGEAPAAKEKGGIVNKTVAEIEVEALPGDLPRSFRVDLSTLLDINQSIYMRDIAVPSGVKVLLDPETVLVSITAPVEEEVVVAPPEVSEVKVETEEKKAARLAEQAANEKDGSAP